jgi:hypothetical protein
MCLFLIIFGLPMSFPVNDVDVIQIGWQQLKSLLMAHGFTTRQISPDVDYEILRHPNSAPRSWGACWAEAMALTKLLAHLI